MWRFAIDMVAVLRVMQNNSSELISDMEEWKLVQQQNLRMSCDSVRHGCIISSHSEWIFNPLKPSDYYIYHPL
jgi:hypothetical protein